MDVYDPVSNAVYPTDRQRIAAWFLDTDYDGRTFCICQAFFPDKSKWNKLARALGGKGLIEPGAFDALSGFVSLPFPCPDHYAAGQSWRIAVKVIDPRGNEGATRTDRGRIDMIERIIIENFKSLRRVDLSLGRAEPVHRHERQRKVEFPRCTPRSARNRQRFHDQRSP